MHANKLLIGNTMSLEIQSTQKPVKFQAELLIKIIIAIIIGIALGLILSLFSGGIVIAKILMIFNSIFSNFLSFIIPLLIVGLVAPGIGHLGRDAGKLLLITIAMAYAFTLFSGFSTYGVTSLLYPFMLDGAALISPDADVSGAIKPYFTIDMPPIMSVTSALIFAFVLGFGLAVTKTERIMDVVDDLRIIINKIISSVIIPLLPLYILTIFMSITYVGEISKVLVVFIKIIILIFVLTVILLLIFFSIAGIVAKKNPLTILKRMMPAYITALGTSSSAATIPVTYESTLSNGVKTSIASFVIPLCATINMPGSMLKIVACSLAVIYTTGMEISFSQYSAFIFTLAVTMVAAPGVPGGAIMTALAPLSAVLGFSQETNALMIALYIVMDSFGTAANVTGDGAIAVILDKIYKHDHHITEDETEA